MSNNMRIIKKTCPFCGSTSYIMVEPKRYNAYVRGNNVQKIFADRSVAYRETLVSGICGVCQQTKFKAPNFQ